MGVLFVFIVGLVLGAAGGVVYVLRQINAGLEDIFG